ncbi:MAG: hypothetical protein AAGA34_10160 [Pseudomonadota bacterium]
MGTIYQWAVVIGIFWVGLSIIAVLPLAFVHRGEGFWLKAIGAGIFPLVLAAFLLLSDGEVDILAEVYLWYYALCLAVATIVAAGVLALLNRLIGLFKGRRSEGDGAEDGETGE